MYLPQLTSGPSAATWGPDSKELIYSMSGSLWRQALGSGTARQLTDAVSYDYQPDWSPDGRWVVYASYAHDAVELWVEGESRIHDRVLWARTVAGSAAAPQPGPWIARRLQP